MNKNNLQTPFVSSPPYVPLLPRRSLVRLGRNRTPRLLFSTDPGHPACTAAEEARDARLATILYYASLRISILFGKSRAFTRKIARIGSSTPVSATLNPQRTRNGGARERSPQPTCVTLLPPRAVGRCGGCDLSRFGQRGRGPIWVLASKT